MATYTINVNGKTYKSSNMETQKGKEETYKKLGVDPSKYDIKISGNGYSYTLTPKSKKSLVKKPSAEAIRNQRRNNYNEEAKRHGFNSRDEVRKLQEDLIKLGYNIGGRNAQGKVVNIPDGYFGNYTRDAYENAWLHHADKMRELGYNEINWGTPSTVTVGNREVIATPQNMAVAQKVKNADDFVNANYGSDAQANMYTLGATQLVSPTSLYAYGRQLADGVPVQDVAMNYLTGQNNGIFEGWEAGQQWANENPRAAVMVNMATDALAGTLAVKAAPKLEAGVRTFGRNMKNAAVQSVSAQIPRMKVSQNVTNAANRATLKGNNRIIYSQIESASMRPGEYLASRGQGLKSNGQLKGNHRGLTGSTNVTPVYDAAVYAPENVVYNMAQAPYSGQEYIAPIRTPNVGVPQVVLTQGIDPSIEGVNYQPIYYNKPTLVPNATLFKKGGLIKKKNTI